MLEPFGEVGGDVPEYFSSRTHFAKIEDKKVIAINKVEKLISWSLVRVQMHSTFQMP